MPDPIWIEGPRTKEDLKTSPAHALSVSSMNRSILQVGCISGWDVVILAASIALYFFVSGMGNIDDQHRNPNMNNKDHLVGKLTNWLPP